MLVLISKLVLVPKAVRVTVLPLCFHLLSIGGFIPDNLVPMRGENMGGHGCGQNGGTGCDWPMWCIIVKGLCSPLNLHQEE